MWQFLFFCYYLLTFTLYLRATLLLKSFLDLFMGRINFFLSFDLYSFIFSGLCFFFQLLTFRLAKSVVSSCIYVILVFLFFWLLYNLLTFFFYTCFNYFIIWFFLYFFLILTFSSKFVLCLYWIAEIFIVSTVNLSFFFELLVCFYSYLS